MYSRKPGRSASTRWYAAEPSRSSSSGQLLAAPPCPRCARPRPRARTSSGSSPGGGPADVSMNTTRARPVRARAARPGAPPCRPSSARAAGGRAARCASATARDVGREPVEASTRAGSSGCVALAVTAVVERDDPVVAGEGVDVVGEVLLGAAEAVHEQQAGGVGSPATATASRRRRRRRPLDARRRDRARTGELHRRNLRAATEPPVNEPVT